MGYACNSQARGQIGGAINSEELISKFTRVASTQTIQNDAQLHALYNEGLQYNTTGDGLVLSPNVVINNNQQAYLHFGSAERIRTKGIVFLHTPAGRQRHASLRCARAARKTPRF